MEIDTNKYFINGPIDPIKIYEMVSKYTLNPELGAYNFFIGQIRADKYQNPETKKEVFVKSILYSAYQNMAVLEFDKIVTDVLKKFDVDSIKILHSLGRVSVGEISMIVMISSKRRGSCFDAVKYAVDQIKSNVPIWKKEFYNDGFEKWVE